MMNRIYYVALIGLLLFTSCVKQNNQTGFAIVVDSETYKQAREEINSYATILESEGLKTFIIEDKWNQPDSIKAQLVLLYNSATPIEGAVFIGDIPVPMLRDAQHFSSAFKMNQEQFKWDRSSIPSDRFYDDFDLKFKYLKQDEEIPLYHYYSLLAESEQKLQSEIYTGRIKAPEHKDKYQQIKAYLKKVVKAHREASEVENIMFFAGHGYNTESMIARIDEKITLTQQFPALNKQKNNIDFIDYTFDDNVKFRLLPELKREDLDLAILHHHGGATAQYLNGMPASSSVNVCSYNIKYYLRSKISSAKRRKRDVNEVIAGYQKSLDVPLSWFEGWDTEEGIKADSIANANLDIYVEDLDDYNSNARFIMFDACFNGSFHKKDYLAGRYIFGEGNTVLVMANSVNSIQDKWPDEMLGLLNCGVRFGNIFKNVSYLESHLIGDPTYKFKSDYDKNFNRNIVLEKNNISYWKSLLNDEQPDVQCLALKMLFENNYNDFSSLATTTYFNSPFNTVRLECLKLLTHYNNDDFIKVVCAATEDSYELTRRFAGYYISDSGDERCIPAVIKANIRNNKARRIRYVYSELLSFFDKDLLLEELNKQVDANDYFLDKEESRKEFIKLVERYAASAAKCTNEILADDNKSSKLAIRNLRNKPFHQYAKDYCKFALETKDDELRLIMIEAFGWFSLSIHKEEIINTCENIANNTDFSDQIKQEALKTINRLK